MSRIKVEHDEAELLEQEVPREEVVKMEIQLEVQQQLQQPGQLEQLKQQGQLGQQPRLQLKEENVEDDDDEEEQAWRMQQQQHLQQLLRQRQQQLEEEEEEEEEDPPKWQIIRYHATSADYRQSDGIQTAVRGFNIEPEEYEIDEIMGHVESDPKRKIYVDYGDRRKFMISWKDRDGYTWEPESHLAGCRYKLHKYLRKLGLKERIQTLVGHVVRGDPRNRCGIDTIIELANKNKPEGCKIAIEELKMGERFVNRDRIYLLGLNFHCFVLLNDTRRGICYVANGRNDLSEFNQLIYSVVRKPLRQLVYEGQRKDGFCGSSAALIAVLMCRLYMSNLYPFYYMVPLKKLKVEFERKLHCYPTKTSTIPMSHEYFHGKKVCPGCGKSYRLIYRKLWGPHEASCKKLKLIEQKFVKAEPICEISD